MTELEEILRIVHVIDASWPRCRLRRQPDGGRTRTDQGTASYLSFELIKKMLALPSSSAACFVKKCQANIVTVAKESFPVG
jgi:hypothetical protein